MVTQVQSRAKEMTKERREEKRGKEKTT